MYTYGIYSYHRYKHTFTSRVHQLESLQALGAREPSIIVLARLAIYWTTNALLVRAVAGVVAGVARAD